MHRKRPARGEVGGGGDNLGGASILFYTVISLDSDIIQGILKQCDPYVFGFH